VKNLTGSETGLVPYGIMSGEFEIALKKKNGEIFPAQISSSLIETDGKKVYQSIVRDITEQKKSEMLLKNLFEVSRLIDSAVNLEEIFKLITDSVQKLVKFDDFIIFLVSKDRKSIYPAYASERFEDLVEGLVFQYGEGSIGRCIETREVLLTEYALNEAQGPLDVTEMNSQIFVPLVTEGECLGVLHISRSMPGAYDQTDVAVLNPLSKIVSSAIKNSKFYTEIHKLNRKLEKGAGEKQRRTEILLKTQHALQTETSWEEGLATIVQSMSKLGFERCSIFLVNPREKMLEFHCGQGEGLPERLSVSLTDPEYFGVQCVLEKKTIRFEDAFQANGKQILSKPGKQGVCARSFVWVPIVVKDEVFAAVGADFISGKRMVTEEDVKDLEILAGVCAAFIGRTKPLIEPVAEETLKTELKHWLDPAECFIVTEAKPKKSYEMFVDLVTHGVPGFVISREHPEKLRKKYKMSKTPVLWLSRTEVENTLNPDDLHKLNYLVEGFARKNGGSVIMLDGLEYLITQNSFQPILKCLYELRNIIVMNKSRLIIPLHKDALSLQEYSILERGFTMLEPD